MDATTTVKAEIKAWERDFRAQHGRNATVEDIKALPHIAEKYKLHKKLMKEADAMDARERKAPPKTPPRPKPKQPTFAVPPAAILSKPRPVTSSVNELTKNPFSPVKRKAGNATAWTSSANPFLTPVKASRTRSPDLSSQNAGPSLVPVSASSAAAVSKARKRLHGEPVSPSPNPREKRRRLDALNSTGDPARASHSRSLSPPVQEGDSFVDDSPMKAPPSGKAFKPLFEEANVHAAMPSSSQPTGPKITTGDRSKAFSRAKTLPGGLFGGVKEGKARSSSSLDVFGDSTTSINGTTSYTKRKDKEKGQPGDGAQNPRKKRLLPGPKGLIPSKDDLFEINLATQVSSSSALQHGSIASRKRSLSVVTIDEKNMRTTSNTWDLLPPSPPPTDDNHGRKASGKGKAKAMNVGKGKSKKVKLSPTGSDDGEMEGVSSEDAEVKTVAWRGRTQSSQLPEVDDTALVLDPELKFHLRRDEPPPPASPLPEKFEVDIPEDMLRVLALSPSDPVRGREAEDVVRNLMMGVRKGGVEIWCPGEVGGEGQDSDEEVIADDWEGEGVPWEVADL